MLGCFWSLYALKNIIPQKLLCCIEKNSIEEENCDLLYAVFFFFFFWYNFWGSVPFVSCVQEGLTTAIVAGVEEREDVFWIVRIFKWDGGQNVYGRCVNMLLVCLQMLFKM